MKVIKRDGRVVDFNREKIAIAIEKANQEVTEKERADRQDIKDIIKYIEALDKKISQITGIPLLRGWRVEHPPTGLRRKHCGQLHPLRKGITH